MLKTIAIFILLAVFASAAEAPRLSDAQRAAIYRALYEQSQAETALMKAQERLRAALNVCGAGFAVAQDERGELACVSIQKESEKK